MDFTVADVDALVRHFCINPRTAQYGPYRPIGGDAAPLKRTVAIAGSLYRYRLVDAEKRPVDLQIYTGIVGLGGLLWEQEVRILLRVAAAGHPGLPTILGGGFQDSAGVAQAVDRPGAPGVAFVATRGASYDLATEGSIAYLAEPTPERRTEALRHFFVLAEALGELHDLGLCHRNLWPGAIDVDDNDDSRGPELRIARFEMSALLANLVNADVVTKGGDSGHASLRALYLENQHPQSLAYCPPERAAFLFPSDRHVTRIEDEKGDVYSFGMMVAEWFAGPIPAELVPRPDSSASEAEARFQVLRAHMRDRLGPKSDVPQPLADLLSAMLAESRESRPTSSEVLLTLTRERSRILAHWREDQRDRQIYVAFMPSKAESTLYRWGWIEHPPSEPAGRDQAQALIETDLAKARLYHAPHGAEPFVRGEDPELLREAKHLLLGARAAWFCTPYRPKTTMGRLDAPMDNVLVIKYVAPRDRHTVRNRLADLFRTSPPVRLQGIKALPTDTDREELKALVADGVPWSELLLGVGAGRVATPEELKYEQAIDWLLEYQGVELRARTYACTVAPAGDRSVVVEYDSSRDVPWTAQSPLLGKFSDDPKLRPQLGEFFGDLAGEGGSEVQLVPDVGGRPGNYRESLRGYVTRENGRDRVRVQLSSQSLPPGRTLYWIRPADFRGTEIALQRQMDGRWGLINNRPLLAQLRNPSSIRMLPYRWSHVGNRLQGQDGPTAVRSLLTHEPFFALQGPPGTGKTTVAAEAVAAYLHAHPGARVLVSAQSNFALDHLALRILRRVNAVDDQGQPTGNWDGVALRIAPREDDKQRIDDVMKGWTGGQLAERRAEQIRARQPEGRDIGPHTRVVLSDWHRLLAGQGDENVLPELGDRMRRASNLIFATCSMATSENVTPSGTRSSVDWVIVEEAAKAWPTELAVPLCRGTRWTLIGDHRQLPAHRRSDIERFLKSCVGDPDEHVALSEADCDTYLEAFDLFRALFGGGQGAGSPPATRPTRVNRPLATLRSQYRMRAPIREVVSRVFYPVEGPPREANGLRPGSLADGTQIAEVPLDGRHWLSGKSLVWLDTEGVADCEDEPQWRNSGEARIVRRVVEELTGAFRPGTGAGTPSLAVLSPYRRQNQLLEQYDVLRSKLYTVHAFQGREADVVVVSLVRDRTRSNRSAPWAGLGHLTSPELANVLLSRAQKLLVVVGRFNHFVASGRPPSPEEADQPEFRGAFWPDVCTAFRTYGDIVRAADLYPWQGES